MTRQALVVGINLYSHLNKLRLPSLDASAIARLLEEHGDFKVTRLPEIIAPDHTLAVSGQATVTAKQLRAAIIQLFKPKGAETPETAILFFAGHGLQRDEGVTEGFLATSDADLNENWGVSLKWLRELLQESPVPNQIVWLDACHSGELFNYQGYEPTAARNRCFIAAARSFEAAFEEIDGSHGILTKALLDALDPKQAKADVDNHALVAHIAARLKKETQSPVCNNAGEPILLTRHRQIETPAAPEADALCPYKGLEFFDDNDHDPRYYHGREAALEQLIGRVKSGDFVAILGVSGSGKSSLARAGLLHQLRLGKKVGGSDRWPRVVVRPGDAPVANLLQALALQTRPFQRPTTDLAQAATPEGLARLASELAGEGRLALLIDQFEEIFTQNKSIPERDRFCELLLGALDLAAQPAQNRLFLCITLRADFLAHCAERPFAGLAKRIQDQSLILGPMSGDELRRAIVEPAQAVGYGVDEGLAARILAEVRDTPGHLPLVQDALTELWRRGQALGSTGRRLALTDYEAIGGVTGALARRADLLYAGLSEEQQELTKWLFIDLTELGEGAEDTRRRRPLAELTPDPSQKEAVIGLIQRLANPENRLLVTGSLTPRNQTAPVATVEVAHEALIRNWPRLRGWLDEHRELRKWLDRLADEAAEWRAGRREPPSGTELAVAEDWCGKFPQRVPAEGHAFIEAGIAGRERAAREEEARRERERQQEESLREERRRAEEEKREAARQADAERRELLRRQEEEQRQAEARHQVEQAQTRATGARKVTRLALASLLVTLLLGGWAWRERGQAESAAEQAEAAATQATQAKQEAQASERQRTASLFDSQLTHGALLVRVEDYAQARQVLGLSRGLDPGIPETRRHARNLLAGYVEIMGGEAEQVYRGAGAALAGGVAVSPDGKWLAAAGERETLVIFDAESGELVRQLEGHDPKAVNNVGSVKSPVFDPQGRWLYSCGYDGRLLRWGLGAPVGGAEGTEWGKEEWQGPSATGLMALALSPDGATLASGDDEGRITLWDIDPATGAHQRREQPLEGHSKGIGDSSRSLSFSPDGKYLASASFDTTVRIWDMDSGQTVHILRGHREPTMGVTFSPDGKTLATTSYDKQIILWNVESGDPLRPLRGHQNIVFGAAFTPDGRGLLTASRDNTLRLWDPASGVTQRLFQGHEAGLWSVAARGERIYTAANDGTVRRWRLEGATGPAPTGAAQWLWEFTPESKGATDKREEMQRLLAELEAAKAEGDGEGNADRQRALLARLLDGLKDLEGPSASPISTAISPDGTFVAVGFKDGALRLYPLPAGAASSRDSAPPPADAPSRLQAAPTGDPPASPNPLWQDDQAHGSTILRVAFNREGTRLATSSHDNTARLWRIEGRGEDGADGPRLTPLHTLKGHTDTVHAVAFSPISLGDGQTLATASYDGKVGLFDTATGKGELHRAADTGQILAVEFDGLGKALMTVNRDDYLIRLWDPASDFTKPIFESAKLQDMPMWATLRPDARQLAAVGRDQIIRIHDLPGPPGVAPTAAAEPRPLVGHEQTVFRAHYTPDGRQLATVGGDATVRLWDLEAPAGISPALFTLRLPTVFGNPGPLWDFDLRRTPDGMLWIAVPLTMGRLALYRLPYDQPPH